jgi:hypothetical protein
MRLVSAWLDFRTIRHKESRAASARYLSMRTGKAYTASRLWEWERGARSTPEVVMKIMREELLPVLLDEAGITEGKMRKKVAKVIEVLL